MHHVQSAVLEYSTDVHSSRDHWAKRANCHKSFSHVQNQLFFTAYFHGSHDALLHIDCFKTSELKAVVARAIFHWRSVMCVSDMTYSWKDLYIKANLMQRILLKVTVNFSICTYMYEIMHNINSRKYVVIFNVINSRLVRTSINSAGR
jgi:CRISPR/Cas system CMR-associated protein Cmr1 (group 7 of RAMP superfamily)